ncbi:hypothetical protein F2P81_009596 [Scophthalmus maximus]|uniref:Uncharacterized protein n=1 Tax=Scophthalmus maximus TaxID=52904 RepID=A0A6A4TAC8_SCOMX|nr:hypothetical protein F2P81_009596 [Scophthalmus maximus]
MARTDEPTPTEVPDSMECPLGKTIPRDIELNPAATAAPVARQASDGALPKDRKQFHFVFMIKPQKAYCYTYRSHNTSF